MSSRRSVRKVSYETDNPLFIKLSLVLIFVPPNSSRPRSGDSRRDVAVIRSFTLGPFFFLASHLPSPQNSLCARVEPFQPPRSGSQRRTVGQEDPDMVDGVFLARPDRLPVVGPSLPDPSFHSSVSTVGTRCDRGSTRPSMNLP